MFDFVLSVNPTGSGLDFTIDRTNLQCAPDTVRCMVDLSNVIFTIPEPAAGALVDERFRKLEIRWDTGDGGSWTAPTKLLSGHELKAIAYGAFMVHVYADPDNYTITCEVSERSILTNWLLRYARESKTISVLSADSVYPTTQTIVINNVGDADFTGAPTGATTINLDTFDSSLSEWTDEYGSNPKRFLFKGGSSFETYVQINNASAPPNLFFGSYGTGKAEINPREAEGVAFDIRGFYGSVSRYDIRFDGLNFVGTYDPSTTAIGEIVGTPANRAITTQSPVDIIIHDCDVSFMREGAYVFQATAGGNQDIEGHWVIADNTITDCGGQYWVYSSSNDEVDGNPSGALLGNRIYCQSDQIDGGGQRFTALRENGHKRFHARSNEFASMDNQNVTCKFMDSPNVEDGQIYTVHWNRFEGSASCANFQGNFGLTGSIQRSIAANVLFEKNVLVGDYSTTYHMTVITTGGVYRDNLFLMPGGQCFDDSSNENANGHAYVNHSFRAALALYERGTVPDATLAVTIEVYSNTFNMKRTVLQNTLSGGGTAEFIYSSLSPWPNITAANNIISGAALTDDNSLGPLTTTALAAPHSLGFKGALNKTLDTAYAPDPADVVDAKPDTGSGALTTATGLISYRDIADTIRPAGSEDQGCWQVTTVAPTTIVSNDFTTDSTTESVSITPSDGSKWTGERIAGASSARGYTTHESQQVYSFFVDGADGGIEKASLVDQFTFGTGGYTAPAAMTAGDTLIAEFEIKVDANGWTVFDFEQDTMTTSASGDLRNQGVRIAVDDSGSWVVIRSELSSGYSTWTQIGGTTAFPFNEWVTVRVVANIDDDANGRVRIWQNDELVLDNSGSVMFNAADILASDGITITGTPQVDVIEFGLSALYDSITNSRTMYARNFTAKIIRA